MNRREFVKTAAVATAVPGVAANALAQPGPMQGKVRRDPSSAAGSCPSPRTRIVASAPLSERKKTTVLSSTFIARTWSSTRPISRSMRSTIAAWTAILAA